MKKNINFASMLVSKVCHDLIGSASSVSFSLDLLKQEEGFDLNQDALSLAYDSSKVLNSRLKYFRAALGYSSLNNEGSSFIAAKELIYDLYKEKDIRIIWSNDYDQILEKFATQINMKLFLNIFLLIFNSIPKSATINVVVNLFKDKEVAIMLTVKGLKITINQDLVKMLSNRFDATEINPRNVQIYSTVLLSNQMSNKLEVEEGEDFFRIAFLLTND